MIIWTEKRVRAIVKEELGYLLDAISQTQQDLNKVLRQTKTDHLNLAREIEILKSKAVDSRDLKTEIEKILRKTPEDTKCITKLKPKRGRGRPRKNK